MISLLLLLKIIGAVCFALSWVLMYLAVRRTERRIDCLKEHYDARITALAESMDGAEDGGGLEGEAMESRRRAMEAERRFTEGIASILNFCPPAVVSQASADLNADNINGKKGE